MTPVNVYLSAQFLTSAQEGSSMLELDADTARAVVGGLLGLSGLFCLLWCRALDTQEEALRRARRAGYVQGFRAGVKFERTESVRALDADAPLGSELNPHRFHVRLGGRT